MHPEAREFLAYCLTMFGRTFYHGKVLDVGSGDINGNNRIYFKEGVEYVGCDVHPGPNVTVCSPCHELTFADGTFDVVISSECFEHDMKYEKSFPAIYRMLKNSGIFVFTCESTGRREHGTRRSTAGDSLSTQLADSEWPDYYKNLTTQDVVASLAGTGKMSELFGYHAFYYNSRTCDLYFVGIKQPLPSSVYTVPYAAPYCSECPEKE